MPSPAGPNSGGTFANDASFGSGSWSNVSKAGTSDNSYAEALGSYVTPGTDGTNYLTATNFGFSIPSGATIDGIVVEFEKQAFNFGSNYVRDSRVRIIKGGTIGSTDKAKTVAWPKTDAYVSHGGSSDLWGESWTDSDINASTFGVAISIVAVSGNYIGNIDHIRVTVYYTAGGGGGAASRLTKYAQNIPYMHGNNRFIRIGR